MKNIIFITLLATSQANALVEFHTGDVVTASDMNGNFKELEDKIEGNTAFAPNALANGEPVHVVSYARGAYILTYSEKATIFINAEGYPSTSLFYYEAGDCTGPAYLHEYSIPSDTEIGVQMLNPSIESQSQYLYDGDTLYKGVSATSVRLNYRSMSHAGGCSTTTGTNIASQVIPSSDLTIPIAITEIGTPLVVSEVVGTAPEGEAIQSANVYANGVLIGVTATMPNKSRSLRVTLKEYNQQTISLGKNGTYTGFNNGGFTSQYLYYVGQGCMGNAYVKTTRPHDYFWNIQLGAQFLLKNGAKYYTSGGQYYKITSGIHSRRNNDGDCYNYGDGQYETDAFQLATETNNPELIAPIFELPITIEGWNPIQQPDLPEAP